jgi:phospholipid/cholesterol/gamma-HCH transport system substrate-binding protein
MMANLEAISKDIKEGKGSAGNILRSDELAKNINAEIARIDRVLADVEKRTPAMLDDVKASVESLKKITANIESGSRDVPEITRSTKKGIEEIREGVKDVDSVVQSLKKAPIIRSNIPPAPQGEITDAGLRK